MLSRLAGFSTRSFMLLDAIRVKLATADYALYKIIRGYFLVLRFVRDIILAEISFVVNLIAETLVSLNLLNKRLFLLYLFKIVLIGIVLLFFVVEFLA